MGDIFFKSVIFFLVFAIIILTIIHLYFWIIYLNSRKNKDSSDPREMIVSPENQIIQIQPPQIPPQLDAIRNYDYRKLYDPLEDPTMRVDRYLLGPLEYRKMFNYPTQGYPDTYRWMGIMINHDESDKNKIIKLFGRQKYPRSNEYQYYTMINMDHDQIKVHLHNHRKELYDHDEVFVPELNKKYTVQLNKDDDMRYAF